MTKAAPWNNKGVGFDARKSAREAARREGKSIGEWLHGVIADHAAELGVAERDVADRDRAEIIASKLRSMNPHDHDRLGPHTAEEGPLALAPRRMRQQETDRDLRQERLGDSDAHDLPQAGVLRLHEEDGDLLEEAIEAIDRRARRVEERTSAALASFAEMLESSEDKRDRERQSIKDLAQKFSTIESTLMDKESDENPIKGSLARLEARLEAIGRRSAAEAEARRKTPAELAIKSEPMRQLEDKLNSILKAVSNQAPPQPAAPQASAAIAPLPDAHVMHGKTPCPPFTLKGKAPSPRRFDNAVAEIASRQASLEENQTREPSPKSNKEESKPQDNPTALARRPMPVSFETMQGELTGLAKAVEEVRRELLRGRDLPDRFAADIEGLRADIGSMSQSLSGLAPRASVTALEDAIEAVAVRVETSRDSGIREAVLRPIEAMVGDLRRAIGELDQRRAIGGLETGIHALGDKIEHLERGGIGAAALASIQEQVDEIRGLVAATATRHGGIERIEDRVTTLVERVESQASSKPDVTVLERLVRDLGRKIEAVRAPSADAHAIEALQAQIGLLASRFDVTTSGLPALSTLERSMRELFAHLEETRASVETSAARAAREVLRIAADENAQAQNRTAQTQDREQGRDIATLKAMQDEADARTSSTLNAVHETLEKVVDRLSSMEDDLEDVRSRHKRPIIETHPSKVMTRGPDDRRAALKTSLGKVSPDQSSLDRTSPGQLRPSQTSLDQILPKPRAFDHVPFAPVPFDQVLLDRMSLDQLPLDEVRIGGVDPAIDAAFDRKPAPRPAKAQPFSMRGKPTDLDDEAGRADFIAAARRAAQVAQTDPSVIAMQRRPGIAPGNATRAGLLARSRDYVASHKKPVLLGFAALFVIIGTMTIVQRTGQLIGLLPNETIADRGASRKVAAAAKPAERVETAADVLAASVDGSALDPNGLAHNDELSPSAMPKTAVPLAGRIAGSDPIQTGAIPSLPAFAAQGGSALPRPTPRASPTGLTVMADAGDGAAEYELGSRYGEGRGVPRDMKAAAKWYEKAATQGIVPAQYRLASLYEKGLGVPQSKDRAKSLYLQAAEAGNPRAMHNLAVILADGDGKPDYDGAAIWFRKAAQYGIHDSQFNLAILLARGLGVSESLMQAYQWFAIAAAKNDADAAKRRDEVGLKLTANDIGVAKALAAAFQPRVANPSTMEVRAPADGWDGATPPSHLNSARAKISSL